MAEAPLLSEEELEALGQALGVDDYASEDSVAFNKNVRPHDLADEDSTLGVNVASIDMINERFVRLFRLGMLETLRTSPKISQEPARIVRFGEYLKSKRPPLAVNTIRVSPLRGNSIIVLEPALVFSALDNFFGGIGRGVGTLPSGRLFTPTETRVIHMIIEIIFYGLREAWSPLTKLEFETVASEINPQFAQIADENDLVIWTRFQPENPKEGGWDLVYPYASLKPMRDLLRSRVQTGDGDEQSDAQWRNQLIHAVRDAEIELKVQLGFLELPVERVQSLQIGEILWFERYEQARVLAAGIESFLATVGEVAGRSAIRIEKSLKPGDK
jgi:flagellar motor switch protein FliM